MKKEIILALILVITLSLVFALPNNKGSNAGLQTNTQEKNSQDANQIQNTIQSKIKAGNYSVDGKILQIQEESQNRLRIKAGNISAECKEDCNLTQEQEQNRTRLKIQLSNGRNAEIKIMPDVASEVALSRLRLRVCNETNNCTIELKEVGKGNETKPVYEMQVEKHMRILAMFRTKAQIKAQVDAETGEIIAVKKPWWSFLAKEE